MLNDKCSMTNGHRCQQAADRRGPSICLYSNPLTYSHSFVMLPDRQDQDKQFPPVSPSYLADKCLPRALELEAKVNYLPRQAFEGLRDPVLRASSVRGATIAWEGFSADSRFLLANIGILALSRWRRLTGVSKSTSCLKRSAKAAGLLL